MKIVILNHYAGTPELGMEYRSYYFAEEWLKMGHNVRIVCSSFSHLRTFNPEIKASTFLEKLDSIEFYWVKTPKYKGNGFRRIVNIFVFLIRIIFNRKKLIYSFNPDVIISSSTYPLDGVVVNLFFKKKKIIHVHEIHDLWPLTIKVLGGYSSYHPFIALLQWAENYVYRKCDILVSILPGTLPYLKKHGLQEHKFFHIPNGFFESQSLKDVPEEHDFLIKSLKEKGNFILLYAGGHNISNALVYLVSACEKLSGQNIAVVLVGNGTEKESLMNTVAEKKLKNIYFLPPVPKDSIPSLLKLSDFLFLGWSNSPLYEFGISPNKVFDYMLAAKPIIHSFSGQYDIVKTACCGISVDAENVEKLADAILKMKDKDSNELYNMGMKGHEFVIKEHNYSVLAERFCNLLKTV
jgi:glycosyltransferase involved in cell wall biosynthesis